MMVSKDLVGLAIRSWRTQRGLTLKQVSDATGMQTSSLSRTERGERDLSASELFALASLFKFNLEEFRSFVETQQAKNDKPMADLVKTVQAHSTGKHNEKQVVRHHD